MVPHVIVSDWKTLGSADKYILPGVGHFDHTMATVRSSGMYEALQDNVLGKGKLLLGICVGMQVLADSSEEGALGGFGWIAGRVRRIDPRGGAIRLPHMGWNSISIRNDPLRLFGGVDATRGFYFLHSYFFEPDSAGSILASTDYGASLACGVTNGRNIFGLQFHPEKSHRNGIAVFKNFADA